MENTAVEMIVFAPNSIRRNSSDPRVALGNISVPATELKGKRASDTITLQGMLCIIDDVYPGGEGVLVSARLPSENTKEMIDKLQKLEFEFDTKICKKIGLKL